MRHPGDPLWYCEGKRGAGKTNHLGESVWRRGECFRKYEISLHLHPFGDVTSEYLGRCVRILGWW